MFSKFTFGDLYQILKNSQKNHTQFSLDSDYFLKKKCFLLAVVLNSAEFAQLLSTMLVPAFFHVTVGLLISVLLYFVSRVYLIFLVYSILVVSNYSEVKKSTWTHP